MIIIWQISRQEFSYFFRKCSLATVSLMVPGLVSSLNWSKITVINMLNIKGRDMLPSTLFQFMIITAWISACMQIHVFYKYSQLIKWSTRHNVHISSFLFVVCQQWQRIKYSFNQDIWAVTRPSFLYFLHCKNDFLF